MSTSKKRIYLYANPENLPTAHFEIDDFYFYLANFMVAVPQLRKYFNSLYQTQKVHFYESAKKSQYYNHALMQDKPLPLEVSMRRTLGILLYSQDEAQLQTDIVKEVIRAYPQLKSLCRNFSLKKYVELQMDFFRQCDARRATMEERSSLLYCTAFVIYCTYGFDVNNPDIQKVYSHIAGDIDMRKREDYSYLLRRLDSINIKESLILFREQRNLLDSLHTGRDILDLMDAYDLHLNPDCGIARTASIKDKELLLQPFFDSGEDKCAIDFAPLRMAMAQLECHGLSPVKYFEGITISSKDRNRALKLLVIDFITLRPGERHGYNGLALHLSAILFGVLARIIKESKDFYFENNNETQYDELGKGSAMNDTFQKQISRLKESLQYQEQNNSVLKAQIESLTVKLSKDAKETLRPLMNEVSLLRAQIAELEKELAAEREKTNELNRLREFAFSIRSGSDILDTKISLNDLIAGKKIYIVGGHTNWRNKMKIAYPTLNIMDGHQASFDERILLDADMVLMNTGNMSHKVYYKVIDVLRKSNVPFDYIGKYANIELLEQEMMEVMEKKAI